MLDKCLKKIDSNSFDLVLIASKRAHQLSTGGHRSTLEVKKDKPSVVALREIEEGLINSSILETSYDFSITEDIKRDTETMAEVNQELSEQVVEDDGSLNEVVEDSATDEIEETKA
jgi:DNA-directed RNA polymerase subunit omega